jgi:hypothetical protein
MVNLQTAVSSRRGVFFLYIMFYVLIETRHYSHIVNSSFRSECYLWKANRIHMDRIYTMKHPFEPEDIFRSRIRIPLDRS